MRIQQIAALVIHALNRLADLVIVVPAAGDIAAHRVHIAVVHPRHAVEIARVAHVHRVSQRGCRGARLERARREVVRDDVVHVGGCHEARDRQACTLGHQSRGQVAEVAAWR